MNDEGVCRTAPATPGLLINLGKEKFRFLIFAITVKLSCNGKTLKSQFSKCLLDHFCFVFINGIY